MKKKLSLIIVLNIVLILSLVLLIIALAFIYKLEYLFNNVGKYQEYIFIPDYALAVDYDKHLENLILPITLLGIAAAINFIAIILVNLPIFKLLFLTITEKNINSKAERSEEKKRARIAQLEADLEELKKD